MNYKIVIIGSGNVATHLSRALSNVGHCICQIYSRNIENARELAATYNCDATSSTSGLITDGDLYILSISDRFIEEFVSNLNFEPKRIIHTSGSTNINALEKFKNHGVFYPLQTFSKKHALNFNEIPICIEASCELLKGELNSLAKQISINVYSISSEQRKQCHIAAIFANNFTNHLYNIAAEILEKKDIPFDIILPLIKETAKKIEYIHPIEAQTGPASRNDKNVINEHIKMLEDNGLDKIYSYISDSIAKYAKNTKNE